MLNVESGCGANDSRKRCIEIPPFDSLFAGSRFNTVSEKEQECKQVSHSVHRSIAVRCVHIQEEANLHHYLEVRDGVKLI